MYSNKTVLKVFGGCSGAAIAATWTLTAGHCVGKAGPLKPIIINMTDYTKVVKEMIRYGSPHLKPSENKQLSKVLEIMRPIDTTNKFRRMVGDIALVRTEPILVESFARLSSIEYSALIGHEVTLIGFGYTRVVPHKHEFSGTYDLDKPLQVIDKALLISCPNDLIFGPLLCIATKCGNFQIVGGGDSGAPALHRTGIVGVVSTGADYLFEGNRRSPTPIARFVSYTPVSSHVDWIYSVVSTE